MHVHVYKRVESGTSVLVLPGRAKHLSPVLLNGLTRWNLKEKVQETLDVIERAPSRVSLGLSM